MVVIVIVKTKHIVITICLHAYNQIPLVYVTTPSTNYLGNYQLDKY